jgi:hypothetical protein
MAKKGALRLLENAAEGCADARVAAVGDSCDVVQLAMKEAGIQPEDKACRCTVSLGVRVLRRLLLLLHTVAMRCTILCRRRRNCCCYFCCFCCAPG